MPTELLKFSPSYVLVGAYRFLTDKNLYLPFWNRSKTTIKRTTLISIPLLIISYPITRFYVTFILARSPFSPKRIHDAFYFGITPSQFTTFLLLLNQFSYFLEFMLKRQVKKSKFEVYDLTVKSRGKSDDFFQPYVEEWLIPPTQRAERSLLREKYYNKILSGPILRFIILRFCLEPLSFIPFLKLFIGAGLNSWNLAKEMHKPYFTSKSLSPLQQSLFLIEHSNLYYQFGFTSALLQSIPILGIFFQISNRIGAAMLAFDLEKVQHSFKNGERERVKVYVPSGSGSTGVEGGKKMEGGEVEGEVEGEVGVGAFPRKKGPVAIDSKGREIGLGLELNRLESSSVGGSLKRE